MEQSFTPVVEGAASSRAQIRPLAGSLLRRELNRRLLFISAVSTALVVILPVADWMIWGRSSFNPLLVLAAILLLGAAVAGVGTLQLRWPESLDKHSVSASVQSLLFELGLLLTLTWVVDLILKAFVHK